MDGGDSCLTKETTLSGRNNRAVGAAYLAKWGCGGSIGKTTNMAEEHASSRRHLGQVEYDKKFAIEVGLHTDLMKDVFTSKSGRKSRDNALFSCCRKLICL